MNDMTVELLIGFVISLMFWLFVELGGYFTTAPWSVVAMMEVL